MIDRRSKGLVVAAVGVTLTAEVLLYLGCQREDPENTPHATRVQAISRDIERTGDDATRAARAAALHLDRRRHLPRLVDASWRLLLRLTTWRASRLPKAC